MPVERAWGGPADLPSREAVLALPGARAGAVALPPKPQLPSLAPRPVDAPGWLHELKLDGFRMLARRVDGRATLYTRGGLDWTSRLAGVARALEQAVPVDAVLDGELVYLGGDGRSDFAALQRSLGRDDPHLFYVAFDLLQLGDVDLRNVALRRRKDLLERLIPSRGRIRYGAHVEASGSEVLARACELGVEGVVSKRADAPYQAGRSRSWLKVKCHGREDFVVLGFLVYNEPLSSLLLGQEQEGVLRYVGRVGTGFSDEMRAELRRRLEPLRRDTPPVDDRDAPAGCCWVEPGLRAEVRYAGWTGGGLLRHAAFLGLREDHAEAVVVPRVRLTHADRVVYPSVGLTKGDVAAYYAHLADLVLRHVARRPLMLVRCPQGLGGPCFHQKHRHHLPASVRPVHVGDARPRFFVDDAAGLLALVQHGALELHPWGATVDDLAHPDRLVFDLDPDEALPWEAVVHGAMEVRALLEELGLASFPKRTGGRGVHVVVPIAPRHPWDEVKRFARLVAEELVRRGPTRYTALPGKEHRTGKIYVDHLRNARDATAVAAWSTRARPGAPVAVPVAWRDLDPEGLSDAPRLDRIVKPAADPWGDLDAVEQALSESMLERLQPRK